MTDKPTGILLHHEKLPELIEMFIALYGNEDILVEDSVTWMLQGHFENGNLVPINWSLEDVNDGFGQSDIISFLAVLKEVLTYVSTISTESKFCINRANLFSMQLDTALIYIKSF